MIILFFSSFKFCQKQNYSIGNDFFYSNLIELSRKYARETMWINIFDEFVLETTLLSARLETTCGLLSS